MTDWHAWHRGYDTPGSPIARRLRVIQQRIEEILAVHTVGRILSLCAGDGRDIIPVLAGRAMGPAPEVVLVEADAELAEAARGRATEAGVAVDVVVGDAGMSRIWEAVLPVDLLLLCGIFGNVSDQDIRTTIETAPALLTPGGVVIWTRGAFTLMDLRPQVRQWFQAAGFRELSFDSEPAGYGVGVNQLITQVDTASLPARLFSFTK